MRRGLGRRGSGRICKGRDCRIALASSFSPTLAEGHQGEREVAAAIVVASAHTLPHFFAGSRRLRLESRDSLGERMNGARDRAEKRAVRARGRSGRVAGRPRSSLDWTPPPTFTQRAAGAKLSLRSPLSRRERSAITLPRRAHLVVSGHQASKASRQQVSVSSVPVAPPQRERKTLCLTVKARDSFERWL